MLSPPSPPVSTPSVTPSFTAYQMRIHYDSLVLDTSLASIKSFAKTCVGKFLAGEHPKESARPHFHLAFYSKYTSVETVRKYMKQHFKFIEQPKASDYQLKADDCPETFYPNWFQYCLKENVVLHTNLPEDEIATLYSAHLSVLSNKKSESNKDQKRKQCDRQVHFENIINKIENGNLLKDLEYPESEEYEVDEMFKPYPSHSDLFNKIPSHTPECAEGKKLKIVIDLVIDEYKDTYFTLSQLEPMINRIMSRYFQYYWKWQMAQNLINRLIR